MTSVLRIPAVLLVLLAGVVCFSLLGVALSHAIPNPESAPAYVNAVFLPQILIAGVFYDADEAPAVIRDIAQALPLTHLVDGLSGAMIDGEGVAANLTALLVLGLRENQDGSNLCNDLGQDRGRENERPGRRLRKVPFIG